LRRAAPDRARFRAGQQAMDQGGCRRHRFRPGLCQGARAHDIARPLDLREPLDALADARRQRVLDLLAGPCQAEGCVERRRIWQPPGIGLAADEDHAWRIRRDDEEEPARQHGSVGKRLAVPRRQGAAQGGAGAAGA
jgi:hypothetical protein